MHVKSDLTREDLAYNLLNFMERFNMSNENFLKTLKAYLFKELRTFELAGHISSINHRFNT